MTGAVVPSWCNTKNPFTVPVLFSNQTFGRVEPTCDEKECKSKNVLVFSQLIFLAVVSIRTQTSGPSNEFSVFALTTGQIFISSFTSPQNHLLVNTPFTRSLTHMEVSPTLSSFRFIAAASDNQLAVFRFSAIGAYLLKSDIAQCGNVSYPGETIQNVEFVQSAGSSKETFIAVLNTKADGSVVLRMIGLLVIGSQSPCEIINNYKTYDIYGVTLPITFYVFTHGGNFFESNKKFSDAMLTNKPQSTRTMIVIHDAKNVKIFTYDTYAPKQDIQMNDASSLSHFYTAKESHNITSVQVMKEKLIRKVVNNTDYCYTHPNENQWENVFLVLGIKKPNGISSLVVRSLLEFAQYRQEYMTNDTMNPVGRTQSNYDMCRASDMYFDRVDNRCVAPVERSIDLPVGEEITQIVTRWIPIPGLVGDFRILDSSYKLENENYCVATYLNVPDLRAQYKMYYIRECIENMRAAKCEQAKYKYFHESTVSNYMQNNIFLSTSSNNVIVFATQQEMCNNMPNNNSFTLVQANKMRYVGQIQDIYVSPNAQHLFTAVSRERWHIESLDRYSEICAKLEVDPNNPFLQDYKQECTTNPARTVDINQYGHYSSMCTNGMYCASTELFEFKEPYSGFYTETYPAQQKV
jgi:hypothetical protein